VLFFPGGVGTRPSIVLFDLRVAWCFLRLFFQDRRPPFPLVRDSAVAPFCVPGRMPPFGSLQVSPHRRRSLVSLFFLKAGSPSSSRNYPDELVQPSHSSPRNGAKFSVSRYLPSQMGHPFRREGSSCELCIAFLAVHAFPRSDFVVLPTVPSTSLQLERSRFAPGSLPSFSHEGWLSLSIGVLGTHVLIGSRHSFFLPGASFTGHPLQSLFLVPLFPCR